MVYNDGANFSAGANVGMIFMMAVEQEYDDLEMAVRTFQNTMMRMRWQQPSRGGGPAPAVPGGGTGALPARGQGGGARRDLHGPGGVRCGRDARRRRRKEFALRLADELKEGDIRINRMRERFLTISQAKVATSGHEAFGSATCAPGQDEGDREPRPPTGPTPRPARWSSGTRVTQTRTAQDCQVLGQEGLGIRKAFVGCYADGRRWSGCSRRHYEEGVAELVGLYGLWSVVVMVGGPKRSVP